MISQDFDYYLKVVEERLWDKNDEAWAEAGTRHGTPFYYEVQKGTTKINKAAYEVALILSLGPSYVGIEKFRQAINSSSPELVTALGGSTVGSLIEDLIEQRLEESNDRV